MPLTFECPHCGRSMTVPDQYAGKEGRCRSCGQRVVAPTLGAPPPSSDFRDASMDLITDEPPPAAPPTLPSPPVPPPPLPQAHAPSPTGGPTGPYAGAPAGTRAEQGGGFRDFCATVAGTLGAFWPFLGWLLFLSPGLLPIAMVKFPDYAGLVLIASLISSPLFLFWWVVDAVDQGLEAGQMVLCFLMLTFCGWIGWLYYWISVRD